MTGAGGILGVPELARVREGVVQRHGIETQCSTEPIKVDPEAHPDTREHQAPGGNEQEVVASDLLRVAPPSALRALCARARCQTARRSAGSLSTGTACATSVTPRSSPSATSAMRRPPAPAAIRRQAPVVAENVQFLLAGKEVAAQRDGDAPCSITTACGRLLLAEFASSLRPHPTFPAIDTTRERADLWWLKRSLLAWLLLARDAARLELRAPRPWCWAEPAGQLGSLPRPEAPPRVPGAPLRYRRSCA